MGQVISVFMGWFGSDREYKVLLIGLDNAGKTTTLYQMHLGQAIETQPTIGSNVETVRHKNVHFEVSFFFFFFLTSTFEYLWLVLSPMHTSLFGGFRF